jgi:tetratricopeptide (TPR) repeat protein
LLDDALESWLNEAFDDHGELQGSGNNTLADLPVTHQQMLTTLGHLRLPINGRSWLQATVMACISYGKLQQSSYLTQYASTLDGVDWRQHAGTTIGWQTLEQLASQLQQAGNYPMANQPYDAIANHQQPDAEFADKIELNDRYAKTLRTMVQYAQPQKNAVRTLELLERSLEPLRSLARTRVNVEDLRNVTQTLLQIGQIYEKRGLPVVATVAEPYFGEMLMHQRNRLKPENRANADALYADAITVSNEAHSYANQLVETQQTTPNIHQLVGTLGQLSRLQRGANQTSEALTNTQEWLMWHRQMSSGAVTPTSRRTQIGILIQLAELHLTTNNHPEAIATLTEAMGMSQSLHSTSETPADYLQRSLILGAHSRSALANGDRNRALEVAIEMLNLRRAITNQAPSMTHVRHLLSAMHLTGQLLGQLNYHNEARNLANEAQHIANQAFRAIPPAKVRYDVAVLRSWSQFVG